LIALFVILEGCSFAAPLVPAQRPEDKDTHELEDPYDLALPDASGGWPARRPEYVIVVDQIRGLG
jgi:hypothetical protein